MRCACAQGITRTSNLSAPIMQLSGAGGELYSLRFSPDGQSMASASFDRLIYLWRVYDECENYMVIKVHPLIINHRCMHACAGCNSWGQQRPCVHMHTQYLMQRPPRVLLAWHDSAWRVAGCRGPRARSGHACTHARARQHVWHVQAPPQRGVVCM